MARTIAICGSMQFINEMERLSASLSSMGFKVHLPELEEGRDHRPKKFYIDAHIEKINESDSVLIANYEKKGNPRLYRSKYADGDCICLSVEEENLYFEWLY